LSSSARKLIGSIALGGAAVALICLAVTARSFHLIDSARSPAMSQYDQPVTMPALQSQLRAPTTGPSVRVAVIGGMTFTGFWDALASRYEQETGVRVELIATGEKNDIATVFRKGGVDVITMHACDTIINLVSEGLAMDPQPWMRNDLIIVGPPADPARIEGMTDAAGALKKIAETKSPFVVQSSLGSQEVLLNILGPNQIILDPAQTTVMFDDRTRSVLTVAGEKHAYTLVGRVPFRSGRAPNNGLAVMVQGDERLRRPFIMEIANPARVPGARVEEARRFAGYCRTPATQAWIAEYGRGKIDDLPLFFPVYVRPG
jgi:tungstate transport system substrate-binding protein